MARTFLFRLTADGVDELRRQLEALGPAGDRAFQAIGNASPRLANALTVAETRVDAVRSRLQRLNADGPATSLWLKAAGSASMELGNNLQGLAYRLGALGSTLASLGPAGLAAAAAISGLTLGAGKFFTATAEAEKVSLRLGAVLKATGDTAGLTQRQIEAFATSLAATALVDDDAVKAAAASLATFRSVSGSLFTATLTQAANLAAVFGGDLQAATVQLGKALEDPIQGLTALKRVGVSFSETQKEMIKGFEETGDRAEAQRLILAALEEQVGGAAAAEGSGLSGSVQRLSNAWGEFWETAPERLEPVKQALLALADLLTSVTASLNADPKHERLATLEAEQKNFVDNFERNKWLAAPGWRSLFAPETIDARRAEDSPDFKGRQAEIEHLQELIRLEGALEQQKINRAAAAAEANRQQIAADSAAQIAATQSAQSAKEQERALAEAARQSEAIAAREAKASEAAFATLEDQIAGLRRERAELDLSEKARFVANEVLQAEAAIRRGLIVDTEGYVALIRAEAAATWDAKTAHEAKVVAEKEATRAAEEAASDRQRIAEQEAKTLAEPFTQALNGIEDAFSQIFTQVFEDGVDSFSALGETVGRIFTQLAAELARLLVFRPVLNGFLGATGLGGLASGLTTTGLSGLSPGSNNGIATGASAGTAGASPFSMLGGLGLLGNGSSGIGTMLFGSPAVPLHNATSGFLGSGGGGAVGAFLNTPLGGGGAAALGSLALSLATTGKIGIGSLISAGLAGIGTAISGPVGGLIGGVVGSLLGGLFGKKPKWKKIKSISGAQLGFDDLGMLGVESVFTRTKGKGVKADPATGQKLGDAVSDSFNDFFLDLGAVFDPSVTGAVQQVYQAKVKGKKKKKEKTYFTGSFADEYIGTANTAEEFLPMFLSGSLAVASEKGLVSGVSETIQTIFKHVFAANNRMGITDTAELERMVGFGKFYDRVDEIRSPAQAAAEALKELEKNLRSAKGTAEEFGLSIDHIDAVFRANFMDDVANELLQLKDPERYALQELEKEKAARVAVAERLGVAITDVEELYALKRQQIVSAGLAGIGGSFKEFFERLLFGPESAVAPETQLSEAEARYQQAVATGDRAGFIGAAETWLALSRQFFASSAPYVAAFRSVLENTKSLGGLDVAIPSFAEGGLHAGGLALVGEEGPELGLFGPARFLDHAGTTRLLKDAIAGPTRSPANDTAASPGAIRSKLASSSATDQIGRLERGIGGLRQELADGFRQLIRVTETGHLYRRYERNSRA